MIQGTIAEGINLRSGRSAGYANAQEYSGRKPAEPLRHDDCKWLRRRRGVQIKSLIFQWARAQETAKRSESWINIPAGKIAPKRSAGHLRINSEEDAY